MKRRIHYQMILFSILFFFPVAKIYASSGDNGKAEAKLSITQQTVGEAVELTVAVTSITNGSAGGSNGSCKYTITIPENILKENGFELAPEERTIVNDLNKAGSGGNATYSHGSYTAVIPGIYTFGMAVNTGGKNGGDPSVTFHPAAPVALAATEIGQTSFVANWNEGAAATAYNIALLVSGEVVKEEEGVEELFFQFEELIPNTTYTYTVTSKAGDLLSLSESNVIEVTTDGAKLGQEGLENFESFILGSEPAQQTITITAENLYSDISLAVDPEGTFSIDKETIGMTDEDKTVKITFNPTTGGAYNAELVLNSQHANETRISLVGSAVPPAPVAIAATNEASSSFTANWSENEFADSYLLTVKDNNDEIVEPYNDLDVEKELSYEVTNLLPTTTYSYTVKAVENSVVSVKSNSIEATTLVGAVITYGAAPVFYQEVNTVDSKNIAINGSYLTDKITVSLSSDENFSLDIEEVELEGGAVSITYQPTTIGIHEVDLVLNSMGAQEVRVKIKGTSVPSPIVAVPATDIDSVSFVANWEARENASSYLLTLKQNESVIFEDSLSEVDLLIPVNKMLVSDLKAGKTYTYTVKVIEDGQTSLPSNAVAVLTHTAPSPYVKVANKTSALIAWNLVNADGYKVSLFNSDIVVAEYDNILITENEFTFEGLTLEAEYSYEVISIYGEKEYSSQKITLATNKDYGQQIRNGGFENWAQEESGEDDSIEPVNWNSFMTADIQIALGGSAKSKKVEANAEIRPESSGTKSARIWSNDILGVKANGNLTTGRIIAGSMTAADLANHNKTLTANPKFNAPFTVQPDSMTVWMKFIPKTSTDIASITATIHDNFDYQDPGNAAIQKHAHSIAKKDFSTVADNAWERLSIPFVRTENKVNPAYMLISITTNKTPGAGSSGDILYIDDIVMIYKPSLTISSLQKTKFIIGDAITVPYTIAGTMSPSNLNADRNIVYLEISDENGIFDNENPVYLAQVQTDISGELTGTLPMVESSNYRVRVVSTNYPMISDAITIVTRTMPDAPVALEATNITPVSFTANWSEVEVATGYLLTVKEMGVEDRKINIPAGVTLYDVKNLRPLTSYSYTISALKEDLVSEASNVINVATIDGSAIVFSGNTSFTTKANFSLSENITTEGVALITDISIEFTENESEYFSIADDIDNLPTEGGVIEIVYNPASLGTHTAKIVLKSELAEDQTIELTGYNYPEAVAALDAENITPNSFTAKWEANDAAEAYLLTVFDDADIALEGYDNLNVGNETSLEITGLASNTEYQYSVKAWAQDLASEVSNKISATTLLKPEIIDDIALEVFEQIVNTSDSQQFTLTANDLFGENAISITLIGSSFFSVDKEEVLSGEEIVLTYNPLVVGRDTVTITFSTEYGESVIAKAYGTSLPVAPTALNAENVTFTSFTAKWEAVENADAYYLTVYDSNGESVSGYDRLNVGAETTASVSGLFKLRNYTYVVEVVINELISAPSNEIAVRTVQNKDDVGVDTFGDEAISLYPNPVKDQLYIKGVVEGCDYIILNTSGAVVLKGIFNGASIEVDQLEPSVYIIKIGNASLMFVKK